MATLTETAYYIRRGIKVGSLLITLVVLGWLSIKVYQIYFVGIKPKVLPPPSVAFGKLPVIVFPEKTHPELTLRLETPTGGTPNLGDRATVYLMPTARSTFMALEQAKETARKMGFKNDPKEITERRYRFESNELLPSSLEMDIVNGSFGLQRNWQADPTTLTDKQLPGKEQAVVEAKTFLRQAGVLVSEMETAQSNVSYLTFSGGQYKKAVSLSEADFVEVNLFRPDIEQQKVLPSDPQKGIVRVIFSGSREVQKKIVLLEYNFFSVDNQQKATYPIKTANTAWRELQTRQGYIANVGENPENVVVIRRIYLAYYDNSLPLGFLMPVIVFEGDNGFYGYVQAVTSDWLEEPISIGGLKNSSQ